MISLPRGLRNNDFQLKRSPLNINSRFQNRLKRVKSVNALRERQWDDRFIYEKIPYYDSFNDKNVLINYKKKYNSSRKKFANINHKSPLNFADNLLNLYRPLSNKTTILHPIISGKNNKNIFKTTSARTRVINDMSKRNNNYINKNSLLYNSYKKKFENLQKDDFFSIASFENNLSDINLLNLKNIIKLWDELFVNNNYRKLFCVIYKELDDEDKEELYQKETNELISIKNNINSLKHYIEQRLNVVKEIFLLNKKLNTEIFNKDNKLNETIIKEISDKIILLREYTVSVCKSMKQLKVKLDGVKNLDKYDISIISETFQFDRNYLIKMKGELNFLKEGFAKYYFNIKNDHTPFLLKASEKNIIDNEKDPYIYLVPIDKDLKNEIMECIYYIYQELIAYQNEKVNNKILRCISPLKRIVLKNKENKHNKDNKDNKDEDQRISNGKEEKEKNIIININDKNIEIKQINKINLKKALSSIENDIKKEKYEIDNKDINEINYNKNNDKINNINNQENELKIINRNNKKGKAGTMINNKDKKNNFKNILQNYQINEHDINNKKNN